MIVITVTKEDVDKLRKATPYPLDTGPTVLSEAEKERLIKLSEEMSEVGQVICKILLWGYRSKSPIPHELGNDTNRQMISRELAHVQFWINYMMDCQDLDINEFKESIRDKRKTVNKWLKHNQIGEKK